MAALRGSITTTICMVGRNDLLIRIETPLVALMMLFLDRHFAQEGFDLLPERGHPWH